MLKLFDVVLWNIKSWTLQRLFDVYITVLQDMLSKNYGKIKGWKYRLNKFKAICKSKP